MLTTHYYAANIKEDTTVSFPPLTEMFYFSGYGFAQKRESPIGGVSPFGHPRITDCYTSTRGISQLRHVLRPLLMFRHPPHTLEFPLIQITYTIVRKAHNSAELYDYLSLLLVVYSVVKVLNEITSNIKTASERYSYILTYPHYRITLLCFFTATH